MALGFAKDQSTVHLGIGLGNGHVRPWTEIEISDNQGRDFPPSQPCESGEPDKEFVSTGACSEPLKLGTGEIDGFATRGHLRHIVSSSRSILGGIHA